MVGNEVTVEVQFLLFLSLCFCRSKKKRDEFQKPADMSPAETGNPATSRDGLIYQGLLHRENGTYHYLYILKTNDLITYNV